VLEQSPAHPVAQPRGGALEAPLGFRDKVPEQQRHVAAALAQRRDPYPHDVQAIVQVATEAAVVDQAGEVDVGRRNGTKLDVPRLAAADRHDLAGLERTQQRSLQRGRRRLDVVEEQQPPVCGLDPSGPPA